MAEEHIKNIDNLVEDQNKINNMQNLRPAIRAQTATRQAERVAMQFKSNQPCDTKSFNQIEYLQDADPVSF
jgi:hypothetical protein